MADVRVAMKVSGVRALLKSEAVQREVDKAGERLADAVAENAATASEDFEYTRGSRSKVTSRGYVQTGSARAMREQARNAVLERGLAQVLS